MSGFVFDEAGDGGYLPYLRARIGHLIAVVLAASGCGTSSTDMRVDAGHDVDAANGDAASARDAELSNDAEVAIDAAALSDGGPWTAGDGEVPLDAARVGDGGGPRAFIVSNRCAQTVWAAALPATTFPNGVVEVAPGASFQVAVDNGWSGRIWGKVECTTSSAGKLACASDPFPSSLAELTLTTSATGLDFYDVSLVDGFNLPVALIAVGHTPDAGHPYDCGDPACAVDLNATCPMVLQDQANGGVLACANDECRVLGGNDAASPDCVYPNQYTEFFKSACPSAYSFPTDDPTSTFTCKGFNDYAVVFCP
jgi:hypothetical protein